MEMGNWSELPRDLLDLIAGRLTVAADRVWFSEVCRNWLSVAQSEANYLRCKPPWLMLVENSDDSNRRGFVGLAGAASAVKETFDLDLPEAKGTRCVGSTGCWIVMVDLDCNMFILNPFSRAKIDLPPLQEFDDFKDFCKRNPIIMTNLFLRNYFISEKVLLAYPISKSPAEAFVAVAIFDGNKRLAYTRKGANSWENIKTDRRCFYDVHFYRGKFYAVNPKGIVFEFSIPFTPNGEPEIVPISDTLIGNIKCQQRRYLVEFDGMLVQVLRYIVFYGETQLTVTGHLEQDYKTESFHVFQLDFVTGEWVEVNDLGQHSIFVGFNNCVSLSASSNSTFKPNCIYFTDDFRFGYVGDSPFPGGRDMGVFNLADCTIKPHYTGRSSLSSSSPPIWVIPTSLYKSHSDK